MITLWLATGILGRSGEAPPPVPPPAVTTGGSALYSQRKLDERRRLEDEQENLKRILRDTIERAYNKATGQEKAEIVEVVTLPDKPKAQDYQRAATRLADPEIPLRLEQLDELKIILREHAAREHRARLDRWISDAIARAEIEADDEEAIEFLLLQ